MGKERAIFAGGCFWCMVEPFDQRPGVISVLSGYTGGHVDNPTYDQVSGHYTGHTEAVEIIFDNRLITYRELIDIYWQLIDPTDADGQFLDRGNNYRPAIFVENEVQREIAQASKDRIQADLDVPVVVTIENTQPFWPAEDYHQDFYKKNPKRYKAIHRYRERFLKIKRLKQRFRKRK